MAVESQWTPEDVGGEFTNETGRAPFDPEPTPPYEETENRLALVARRSTHTAKRHAGAKLYAVPTTVVQRPAMPFNGTCWGRPMTRRGKSPIRTMVTTAAAQAAIVRILLALQ
jgi:hypothetical protein